MICQHERRVVDIADTVDGRTFDEISSVVEFSFQDGVDQIIGLHRLVYFVCVYFDDKSWVRITLIHQRRPPIATLLAVDSFPDNK